MNIRKITDKSWIASVNKKPAGIIHKKEDGFYFCTPKKTVVYKSMKSVKENAEKDFQLNAESE
jgi:hypothetical protein